MKWEIAAVVALVAMAIASEAMISKFPKPLRLAATVSSGLTPILAKVYTGESEPEA
jgi:hypothetical protein